ncbi:hypothetical protein TELCIR_01669 [Teladorsagia circumcincta]|uniref:TLC domain-containing protein n=1 Tax=Teladorsagia circumcincta TaxID=45464 RepID=A0A2G9V1C1_TELCI|nr:hypothetical protein TELCIR_01669 [Teladorsagia circumcincta]
MSTLLIVLCTRKLYGFALMAYLVEVSTVLLHMRTMIRLRGYARQGSAPYNAVINANMACLFVYRYVTLTYLLYVVFFQEEMQNCPLLMKAYLVFDLLFLAYHTTHLFIVLAKKDGFFGFEMHSLDEDEVDPLGSVNAKKEKKN